MLHGRTGELKPYKSDLEYLENCFKLLMTELMCGRHRRWVARCCKNSYR